MLGAAIYSIACDRVNYWIFIPVLVQYLAGGPVLNESLTEFASGS